jgi:hypothetical protein
MTRLFVVFVAIVTGACSPFDFIRKSPGDPMAGEKRLRLAPLSWEGAMIDGMREDHWRQQLPEDWKQEWPGEKVDAARALDIAITSRIADGEIGLAYPEDPGATRFTLKPRVTFLQTGGARPTLIAVELDVYDSNGALIEAIETSAKAGDFFKGFDARLRKVISIAGDNLGRYILKRTEPK